MYKARYATVEDSKQILNMYMNEETYGGTFDDSRDTISAIENLISNKELIVVESVSVLIGSVQVLTNSHSAWLLRFSITDNKEATQTLFNFATSELKNRGHKSVIVYSPADGSLDERYSNLGLVKGHTYSAFFTDL